MGFPMPISTFLNQPPAPAPSATRRPASSHCNTPGAAGRTKQTETRWYNSPQTPPGHTASRKTLLLSLAEIAWCSYSGGETVNEALKEGWQQGVAHSMDDGIVTQGEEARLWEFRDRLALSDGLEPAYTAGYYRKIRLPETCPRSAQ